jgi:hypothetical protein
MKVLTIYPPENGNIRQYMVGIVKSRKVFVFIFDFETKLDFEVQKNL